MPSRLPVVGLCVLLVCTGCLGVFDQRPPSDERAVELRSEFGDAVDDVDAYRYESDVSVSASAGDRYRSASVAGNGSVNRTKRRIRSVAVSDGERRRAFVVEDAAYRECGEPWDGWGVDTLDDETPWVEYTTLGRYRAILNDSRVYARGTETVNGTETAVVVAYPTKETLTSTTESRAGTDLGNVDLKNATLKLWLDPATGRPTKSLFRVEVNTRGATAEAVVETRYHSYGDHVRISPPDSIYTDQYDLGCPGS